MSGLAACRNSETPWTSKPPGSRWAVCRWGWLRSALIFQQAIAHTIGANPRLHLTPATSCPPAVLYFDPFADLVATEGSVDHPVELSGFDAGGYVTRHSSPCQFASQSRSKRPFGCNRAALSLSTIVDTPKCGPGCVPPYMPVSRPRLASRRCAPANHIPHLGVLLQETADFVAQT